MFIDRGVKEACTPLGVRCHGDHVRRRMSMPHATRLNKGDFAHGTPKGVHPSLALVIYKHPTPSE
jgi:hypothetical protein